MAISQIIGFVGTILVVAAYLPQIAHLIKEHCSGGVSESAFFMWFLASLLLLIHAVMIRDFVFTILQGINTTFNGVVLAYAHIFEQGTCPAHGGRP